MSHPLIWVRPADDGGIFGSARVRHGGVRERGRHCVLFWSERSPTVWESGLSAGGGPDPGSGGGDGRGGGVHGDRALREGEAAAAQAVRAVREGNAAARHARRHFRGVDFEAFHHGFAAWAARFVGVPGDVVAIDGKTARRTFKKAKGEAAIHVVTAYAVERRLVLGQVKTEQKSNEITAIPKLLDALSLQGATVTIDATGCQREIARKINDKGADYILALKGNQPTLAEDVRLFDAEQSARNFADATVDQAQTVDGDHGRIETRKVTVYQNVEWLQDRHAWPGLKSVIKVESRREIGDKIETETRFYLASAVLTAIVAAAFVRGHWGIENSLHWVLDMVMRDDESRVRTGNAAANLAIIKHIAYNLIRRGKGRHSFRSKRKLAAWDEDYLLSLLVA